MIALQPMTEKIRREETTFIVLLMGKGELCDDARRHDFGKPARLTSSRP